MNGTSARSTSTVTVTAPPPSVAVYVDDPNDTVGGSQLSSSSSATVAVAGLPAATPDGSVPKPIRTLSPRSLSESSTAVTVNVVDVCAAPNVTFGGTPV